MGTAPRLSRIAGAAGALVAFALCIRLAWLWISLTDEADVGSRDNSLSYVLCMGVVWAGFMTFLAVRAFRGERYSLLGFGCMVLSLAAVFRIFIDPRGGGPPLHLFAKAVREFHGYAYVIPCVLVGLLALTAFALQRPRPAPRTP